MGISRREFLKRSAIATAAIGLSRARIAGSSQPALVSNAAKKVVILGAGMAGLVAGYELSQLGHNVTILEARTRPGGRVQTLRDPFSDGLYAEAGAARIPEDHDLTLKYVKLFNVPLEPMYPARLSALRFDNGNRKEVDSDGYTEGLGQYFGSDLGGSTSRWTKIKGGTDVLPRAFAQRLADKIRYASPVVRIEADEKGQRVVYLHGGIPETITADRVLCTIPFSVLRDIELPAVISEQKKMVIHDARYASVSRVYLQTKNRIWETRGLSGFALTANGVEIWQPTWSQPGPRGILMTYARPGESERIANLKEGDRITSTLTQLDAMFTGLRESFEVGASKCWIQDEWSRGAWSFVRAPVFTNGSPAEGNIHFAGEHLSNWSSWMQGALSSGLRAAKEIDTAS